jgi:hypothetical protein
VYREVLVRGNIPPRLYLGIAKAETLQLDVIKTFVALFNMNSAKCMLLPMHVDVNALTWRSICRMDWWINASCTSESVIGPK